MIRFSLRMKNKFLNMMFEKKKIRLVMNCYNSINFLKTYLYKVIEIIFSNNMDSFKNLHAQIYKVITVKDFCKINSYKYSVIEEEQFRDICIPHFCNDGNKEIIINSKSPEIYVAEIEKASVIGENSVIISGNYCLYDVAKRNNEKRYNLRFGSVRNIDEDYAIVESIKSNERIPNAISLIGFASFNYYHFTIELLSRIQYIDKFKEYMSIPILVDEKALSIPQFKEILNMVNENNHPIIPIKKNHIYEIEKLVYPSYNTWLPINLEKGMKTKAEDFLMAKSTIEYIRNRVLKFNKIYEDSLNGYRRIFISRKNAKNKRLINEEEVIEITKKYNLEIVYPEELTFLQQVKLFSESEYIIGSTGAAFTNILFCPKNAKIMCIIPKKYMFYAYSTIAKILNLQCAFLDAEVIKKEQAISMEYYRMDIDYYEKCLKKIYYKS